MNNKGYVIGIIVIILVILGYVFYVGMSNETTSQAQEQGANAAGNTSTSGTVSDSGSQDETQAPAATVGGGIPGQPNASSEAPAGAAYNPSLQVNYTDQGFVPKTITIKRGETVRFMNQASTGYMWVGSDPHPSHTDYPGFDQKAVGQKGDIYEFTFSNPGTWGYHNHLDPSMTGTVIVK